MRRYPLRFSIHHSVSNLLGSVRSGFFSICGFPSIHQPVHTTTLLPQCDYLSIPAKSGGFRCWYRARSSLQTKFVLPSSLRQTHTHTKFNLGLVTARARSYTRDAPLPNHPRQGSARHETDHTTAAVGLPVDPHEIRRFSLPILRGQQSATNVQQYTSHTPQYTKREFSLRTQTLQ